MELFELYLSPINETQFKAIVIQSPAGEGETESKLPFWEGIQDRRMTLIKTLESDRFRSESFGLAGEQDWMQGACILDSAGSAFQPDFLANIGKELYQSLFPPLYLQALELWQRLLGQEHPNVASSLNNLANLYNSQGRYAEAEPLYLQALELSQRLLGQQHPHVASSLNSLALLYKSQGRYAEAEPLYLQALELRQRLLGQEHPDVALSLNNLAYLYYSQGRYAEAEPLYLQALEIAERQLGVNHPNTISIRKNLQSLREQR